VYGVVVEDADVATRLTCLRCTELSQPIDVKSHFDRGSELCRPAHFRFAPQLTPDPK
jgi:hypothetical protein